MAKKKKAVKAQPQPSAGAEPKAQGKAEAKPEVKVQTQVVIDDIPETKAKVPHPAPPRPPPPMRWDEYDGNGSLEDWNRFMKDLGFDSEFPSKTQCKKVGRVDTQIPITGMTFFLPPFSPFLPSPIL